MTEFRLAPEDWLRLEALKDEPVYIDHDTPDEYSNAMRCGMVRVILGDFDLRGHHVHALALTPAGYAMLAERERCQRLDIQTGAAVEVDVCSPQPVRRSDRLWSTIRRLARRGDVYCRLVVAADGGKGVRLSAEDVARITADEAVIAAAETLAEREVDRG